MKNLQLSILLFLNFLPAQVHADSIEVSGIVSGTWNVDTVNVVGNIQIREVETLEIAPGTDVIFRGEFYFEIKGSLKAIGTENHPIFFTINDTTGFHNDTIPDGGWKQLRIENIAPSVDSTILRYCDFSFGKAVAPDSIHGYGGAVCIRNANNIAIQNCNFRNNYAYYNGGAVYLEEASIKITGNHFESNRCGQTFAYYGYGGGICSDWSDPIITHNFFTLNSSTGVGGGLCVRFSDCLVSHNIFDENFSAIGGAFSILHIDTCHQAISNNLVINNGSAFFGAGISTHNCSPLYVNNTVCNNHCIGGGGGFYCKDSVAPELFNNIFYGNTQYGGESNQVYLWDLLAQPHFYYNNIEGGCENFDGTGGVAYSGNYENNMDEDPMFGTENYFPELTSPCVNSGTPDTAGLMIPQHDLARFSRIVGGLIDIGAYENQDPVFLPEPHLINFQISDPNPNPATGFTNFSLTLHKPQHIQIRIVDASGQLVETLTDRKYVAGKHEITWVTKPFLASGNYFAFISSNKQSLVKKIILH